VRLPDLATARTAGGNTSPASVFLAIALVPAFGSDSFADTSREMARRLGHPPDIVFDASDTYLKLRNLRI
jgi:hypothetical protein